MVMNFEVPPLVDVRVIGDLLGTPAICFQLDLVLREIEEGEVGFGLPPPVQGILPGWVTFWRRSCCGPQLVLDHVLTTLEYVGSFRPVATVLAGRSAYVPRGSVLRPAERPWRRDLLGRTSRCASGMPRGCGRLGVQGRAGLLVATEPHEDEKENRR